MQIRSRSTWDARAPRRRTPIAMPTAELWLHHTAGSTSQSIRSIQDDHMDGRGWSDIAYSFMVDQAGNVSAGRGAGIAGGHTRGRNTVSHAICAIGNFEQDDPSDELLESVAQLVAHGVTNRWWTGPITGPHKSAPGASTSCCGNHLIAAIPAINARATAVLAAPVDATEEQPAAVVEPRWEPFDVRGVVDDLAAPGGGAWVLARDGGVFAFGGAPFHGSPVGRTYWGRRTAARLRVEGDGYVVVASTGETYRFPEV